MFLPSLFTDLLRDPRDEPLLRVAVLGSVLLPVGVSLFLVPRLQPAAFWPLALLWLATYVVNIERFITMYHDIHHRPLFRKQHRWLDAYVRHVFGAAYGSTPMTYVSHHVLMHHPTENGRADESTTHPYRRDSVADFARYYVRFFVSVVALTGFLKRRYPRKPGFARRLVVGERVWALAVLALLWVDPWATAVVCLLPVVLTRSLLIAGNWGEHAFLDPADPMNVYTSSANIIGEEVNRNAFNVGYHLDHHLRPGAHFSTHPAHYAANVATYGAHDAVVFRDLNYPLIWLYLMRKRYDLLADRFVQLPGAPERTHAQIQDLLRSRVVPVPDGC